MVARGHLREGTVQETVDRLQAVRDALDRLQAVRNALDDVLEAVAAVPTAGSTRSMKSLLGAIRWDAGWGKDKVLAEIRYGAAA
jgi:hypothetical protein